MSRQHRVPRQRNGTTPQLVGRYPDYDVLSQTGHWDDETRRVVLDRVENVPPIRFFTHAEAATLAAFCDVATAQECIRDIILRAFAEHEASACEG